MVFEEKYKALVRAAIILLIVIVVLTGILTAIIAALYEAQTVQYGPVEGIWYCDELHLQVSYNLGAEAHLQVDGKDVLCTIASHPKSQFLKVYKVKDIVETSEGRGYLSGEQIFEFTYLNYSNDFFSVTDNKGKTYNFIRIK